MDVPPMKMVARPESPLLGKGAYGEVVQISEKECAKVYHRPIDYSREAFFMHEIQWLIRDNEPLAAFVQQHIAIPLVLGNVEDRPAISMEMHDRDLCRLVSVQGAIVGEPFLRLYRDVTSGVTWLHKVLGALWCDPKPDNVLLGFDGGWRIADFGVWRGNTEASPRDTAFAPSFRAPEILMEYPFTRMHLAEWWAVGLTFDYANTGRFTFADGLTLNELIAAQAAYVGTTNVPMKTLGMLESMGIGVGYGTLESLEHAPPDASLYIDLLRFDPEQRRSPALNKDIPAPKGNRAHPMFPAEVVPIDGDARATACRVLVDVSHDNRLSCQMTVAAITVMDSVLQQPPGPHSLGDLLMASVSIANSLLFDGEFDNATARYNKVLRELYMGGTGKPAPFSMIGQVAPVVNWVLEHRLHHRLPLGMASWDLELNTSDAVWALVKEPLAFYTAHIERHE